MEFEKDIQSLEAANILLAQSQPTNSLLDAVEEVKKLQQQLAAANDALKRERDRADLFASELQRLRAAMSSPGSGLSSPAASPSSPSFATATSVQAATTTGQDATAANEDMVLVPRSTLEMLYLKERAMDAVKEGITIADARAPDMPLVYVNEGFARLTGYPIDTFSLGKNCRFLQGPGTEQETVMQLSKAIKAGQPCVVQITNYKRNGNPFLNYLSLTPVHDTAGNLSHYVGIQADITELVLRRQAELAAKHAAVEAAAATEAKSQFLARMSHEIRTPLNGMIAVGQLLADTKLTPTQWDLVNTIRCSGEALLTLITDILDFSKIEANKMVLSSSPFALESTIEAAMEIAGLHAARKQLQVSYHVGPGVPEWIIGDAQRLQQVLLNILNNALKFTESGEVLLEVWAQSPSPSLSASSSPSSSLSIEDALAETTISGVAAISKEEKKEEEDLSNIVEIHFSVRDTGIGISAPDLARLFQSFSQVDASPTRRFGGSGLGLTISQKLSEAMGGKMWAESAGLGRGSTFRWHIRTEKASKDDVDSAIAGTGRGWGRPVHAVDTISPALGKKILIVEPCDMVRQIMLLALRQWGCEVCAVESERAAVAKLKLRPNESPQTPVPVPSRVSAGKSRLSLAQSAGGDELRDALAASAACCGPFDIVVLDVSHVSVLHALMESCEEDESRRVVFLGWPGHVDPEKEEEERQAASSLEEQAKMLARHVKSTLPEEAAPPAYASGTLDAPTLPLPPKVITESNKSAKRNLGYVVVSRPLRQGRLRLALQEVIEMEIEHNNSNSNPVSPTSSSYNTKNNNNRSSNNSNLPLAPSTAGLSDMATSCGGDVRSEIDAAATTSTASETMLRSLGSSGSLLQAAPVKRISSGSSLATADGMLGGPNSRDNSTRRLLLAEDNAINMKVALGILRRLGFTNVVTAPDGVAAVEAVAAAGGPAAFDAILMDLHMPRKGGIEAVQDIRRAWPHQHTKVIAVTADAFEDTRDMCVANGFTGWLAKPFRVEEFARIMGQT